MACISASLTGFRAGFYLILYLYFFCEAFMRQASVLFALSLFVGCNGNNGSDAIDLNWEAGEEFHVATSYRIGSPRTEEGTVSLEGTEERALG